MTDTRAMDAAQAVPSTAVPSTALAKRSASARRRERYSAFVPLALFLLAAIVVPFLLPFGPEETAGSVLESPNGTNWFGTDSTGFDVFTRVIYAARLDLLIAVTSVAGAFVVAAPLGALSGYMRGGVDTVTMRIMDFLQSFPLFILAMALVAVAGPSVPNVILVVGLLSMPIFVRLIRAEVLSLRSRAFVEAARVAGVGTPRIVMRHIVPNALSTAIAQASTQIGWALLLTAGLSFVGAGVRPPTAEWGGMISEGAQYMITGDWWVALFPGLALVLAVIAFSLAGEAVERMMDVTRRRSS